VLTGTLLVIVADLDQGAGFRFGPVRIEQAVSFTMSFQEKWTDAVTVLDVHSNIRMDPETTAWIAPEARQV
jgi:hypothetical protein